MAAFSRGRPIGLFLSSQFSIPFRATPSRAPLFSSITIEQSRYFTQSVSRLGSTKKQTKSRYNDLIRERERHRALLAEASKKREAARSARTEDESIRQLDGEHILQTGTSSVKESDVGASPIAGEASAVSTVSKRFV